MLFAELVLGFDICSWFGFHRGKILYIKWLWRSIKPGRIIPLVWITIDSREIVIRSPTAAICSSISNNVPFLILWSVRRIRPINAIGSFCPKITFDKKITNKKQCKWYSIFCSFVIDHWSYALLYSTRNLYLRIK